MNGVLVLHKVGWLIIFLPSLVLTLDFPSVAFPCFPFSSAGGRWGRSCNISCWCSWRAAGLSTRLGALTLSATIGSGHLRHSGLCRYCFYSAFIILFRERTCLHDQVWLTADIAEKIEPKHLSCLPAQFESNLHCIRRKKISR